MPRQSPLEWQRLSRAIRRHALAQIGLLTLLVGITHAFPLLGDGWTTCEIAATGATDAWCVAFFHLYEVPLAALFVYQIRVAWRPLTPATLPYYCFLTLFQLVMLFVFLTFESSALLGAIHRQAATWEVTLLLGGCAGMLVNCLLGFHVVFARALPVYLAVRSPDRA